MPQTTAAAAAMQQQHQLQLQLQLVQLQLAQLEQNERAATARTARVIVAASARIMNDNLPTTPQQERQLLHQHLLAHPRNSNPNFISNLPASLLSPVNSAPAVSSPSFQQELAWNILNAQQQQQNQHQQQHQHQNQHQHQHHQQQQHQHHQHHQQQQHQQHQHQNQNQHQHQHQQHQHQHQNQHQHQQLPLFPSNNRASFAPAAAHLPQTRFSFANGHGHGHHQNQFLRSAVPQLDSTNLPLIQASLQQQFYDPLRRQIQHKNQSQTAAAALSSPSFNAASNQLSSPYSQVLGNVNNSMASASASENDNAKKNPNVSINLVSIGTSSQHSSNPSSLTTNTTSSTSTTCTTATADGVPCTPKIKNTSTLSSSKSSSHSLHENNKKKSLKTANHKSFKRKKVKAVGNAKSKAKSDTNVAIGRIPTRPPILVNASPLPKSGDFFAPTQLLSEEIDCGDGLIFEDLDLLSPDQFLQVPGVRKRLYKKTKQKMIQRKISKKQKVSQESSLCGDANGLANASGNLTELYSGRMSISGVSINLGTDHLTSLPAAAALDIANRLYRGAENNRPYYVLSEVEVLKALGSIGYGTTVDPQEFKHSLFTQERKKYFESLVDRALSSLGGRDKVYADILCNLNKYGDKKSAKATATASAMETSKTVVVSSSSESVDTSSSKTSRRKRMAEHEACVKPQDLKNTVTDLKHTGEHVIYDVHDDGTFSWRLDD